MSSSYSDLGMTISPEQVVEWDRQYVIPFYARKPVLFVKGEGVRLTDATGRKYLDFLGGYAVNALGHCHPRVVEAMVKQVRTLLHVSNIYYTEQQSRLAKTLTEHAGLDRVFFNNSGAEANEAAIKIVRKWAKGKIGPNAGDIIVCDGSFHGRTLAMIAATGQDKFRAGFGPDCPGFIHVPFNDVDAIETAIGPNTCGVFVEPIQCESGVRVPASDYLNKVRALCDRKGIALVLDEVQTGMGRTGKYFCHQHNGIRPDVMTVAKALGSGMPIAAVLVRNEMLEGIHTGDHGTTFGGGPLACTAGIATFEAMEQEDILTNCNAMGSYFRDGLLDLQAKHPVIKDVRGQGLIWGLEMETPIAKEIGDRLLEKGLVVNAIGEHVVRMSPPLIITDGDVDEALSILDAVLSESRDG